MFNLNLDYINESPTDFNEGCSTVSELCPDLTFNEIPLDKIKRRPQFNLSKLKRFNKIREKEMNRFKKDYTQRIIKIEPAVKRWLLKDRTLNNYSYKVIEEIDSIFNNNSTIDSYVIELTQESLPGMEDDLDINIFLPKKINSDEFRELWRRISYQSVIIIKNFARNKDEFEDLLERTTITLRNF